MNPEVCQLMLLNRDEIEPFAAWAFKQENPRRAAAWDRP